jgi:hypothetical protein
MREWMRRSFAPGFIAGAICSTALGAQAAPAAKGAEKDVCSLATDAEFQQAQGVNPQIGILPGTPEATQMLWGPHCDYSTGAIDLFTEKSPSAELERVLGLTKARKQRDSVDGLGEKAFFTVIYPGDHNRQRGFLAVTKGPRIVTLSLDPRGGDAPETTRPKLEALGKLVVSRLE